MARKSIDPAFRAAVGRRFLAARRTFSPTAAQAAKEFDVELSVWSGWERGLYLPDPTILVELQKRRGISVDFLYCADEGNLKVNTRDAILAELQKIPEFSLAEISAAPHRTPVVRTGGKGGPKPKRPR